MNTQKNKYDIYNANCPSRKVIEIISDKWTILIVKKLSQKTYRFGELKREIGGISQKVLTQMLRKLEENGLVSRESFDVLPLKVEYSLTPLGLNLSAIFNLITDWADKHIEEIINAKNQFKNKC